MLSVFESLDVRMERAVLSFLPVCADTLDNQKPSPLFYVHTQKMAKKLSSHVHELCCFVLTCALLPCCSLPEQHLTEGRSSVCPAAPPLHS